MNVSYRWLKELLPGLEMEPEAVADHLALRGAPVEGMEVPGAGLGDVVVGKVVEAGPHPNADRLRLCRVDGGEGVVQVVCGAPNVKEGTFYPFAPVGAVLPGDFRIRKAKIRGERSVGMLCSARELGLGTDHTGILELPGEHTPGEPFVKALGLDDTTLDVEITANRGDLLSHLGVARELVEAAGDPPALPELPGDPGVELSWVEGEGSVESGGVRIGLSDPELCPRYLGAVIRGVEVRPSPPWLQARLRGAGARPINNVVDATNYVMLELGQPLHAFDLSELADSTIVVRRAAAGETSFTTLDDEERALTREMLLICDAEAPVAIAGVMGGADSEVGAGTTDVLLECALFDPPSIRSTRKALGLSTDASYRFERGVDPEGLRRAVERAVGLILAVAGGEVAGPVLDARAGTPWEAEVVSLRLSRVAQLLGVALPAERVRALLEPLGFSVVGEEAGTLRVRVPGHRSYDVTREVDLIEEVARTHGYDAFPEELGAYRPNTVPDHPLFRLEDELRDLLVARGFFEAQTPAFVGEAEGEVGVSNPLNTREPFVRRTLLPSLGRRVEYNLARGNRDVRLFELGTSFRSEEGADRPEEETRLVVAFTGRRDPPHWSAEDAPFTFWDLKGLLEEVAATAWRGPVTLAPVEGEEGLFARDACRVLHAGGEVGLGGRLREDLLDVPPWAGAVWGLELSLPSEVPEAPVPVHHPLPQHPAVERDLAVLVPERVAGGAVVEAVGRAAGPFLEERALFDVYRGDELPDGVRSMAFSLRFRAPDRTLKDDEVDRAVADVVRTLEEELGVRPRT
jgi:phenylalanyl-tRNA synthetase beta chain